MLIAPDDRGKTPLYFRHLVEVRAQKLFLLIHGTENVPHVLPAVLMLFVDVQTGSGLLGWWVRHAILRAEACVLVAVQLRRMRRLCLLASSRDAAHRRGHREQSLAHFLNHALQVRRLPSQIFCFQSR